MQQSTLNYLADALATQENSVFTTRTESFNSRLLQKGEAVKWVEEVYKALEGKGNCWQLEFQLPNGIETESVRLSIDGALHFNRYRAVTLNAGLYGKFNPAWLAAYRRYCHSLERECLKEGSRAGIWTNPQAEQHFGKAQESGDFFGTGAAGWRLKAYQDFLADLYIFKAKQQHKRISEYDRLMVQGKLIPLQQLLISRTETNRQYLVKYLGRQLELPVQNTGK